MDQYNFHSITISGKVATGTTTLAKNLERILSWKYINAGAISRAYDRKHGRVEYEHGSLIRPDDYEKKMDEQTKKILTAQKNIIYEAWFAGFISRNIDGVVRVLLICSSDAVKIDRVANRDNLTIQEAKKFIKIREEENIAKWKQLYGDHDFWDKKIFHVVIDTYSSGTMETVGKVLDKLGYK